MHLVTFSRNKSVNDPSVRLGALTPDGQSIWDLNEAIEPSGERLGYTNEQLLSCFDLDGPRWTRISAVEKELNQGAKSGESSAKVIPCTDVQILSPVLHPGKIICIGLNYRDHAAESNMPIPERPVIFSKFSTCVASPGQPVVLPSASAKVDYEAELAVIIGRPARQVTRTRAASYVFGYTCFNDVTARDFQFADGQWQRGKSCDTFAPIGPLVVTADEIPDPHRLSIKLRLNGQTMQDSNTDQLIFGIYDLIAFISETITLEPGDVIATGTPPGVGFARQPPVFLKHGDTVEVEIESIGVLSNPIISLAK